jgi:hypothetical protein
MLPPGEVEAARIAVEFTLETHQGKTRLRIVHSGFGQGAAWDNELDGISEGWQGELRSLRHYLERHRGRDRRVGKATITTTTPRDAAWAKLTGSGGYRVSPPEPREGQPYEVVAPGGERLSGTVELCLPRITLAGTVRELNDAWLRLLTWKDATGNTGVWVWLATYGADPERVQSFEARAEETLKRLFPVSPPAA